MIQNTPTLPSSSYAATAASRRAFIRFATAHNCTPPTAITAWNATPGRISPMEVNPFAALTTEDTITTIQASAKIRIV